MKIIGLTGRMCSGKSTIANFFSQLGCVVIAADKLAKIVLATPETILEIKKTFGENVFENGKISFSKLAKESFSSNEAVIKLGAITHPKIAQRFLLEIQKVKKKNTDAIVIYDAPLLLETNAYQKMDKTILVITDYAIILERWRKKIIQGKTHLQEHDLQARIKYQIEPHKAKKMVDFIIDGNQDFGGIKQQVCTIYKKI